MFPGGWEPWKDEKGALAQLEGKQTMKLVKGWPESLLLMEGVKYRNKNYTTELSPGKMMAN